ncbi:MAG: Holliday junction branch migration protein RuvA [Chloroflexi bacterium]|nr:Holliday junction branch migration protein RuvA [Chloroflexota bacterium]
MIASIEGNVSQILDDSVIITTSGIGFRVFVSPEICHKIEPHKALALHTYLVVREEALILYGFETIEERDMFILLISVSGVGPRTALSILSTLSLEIISNAVMKEQPDIFNRVTGVGKKTAQGIILHLQGKVNKNYLNTSIPLKDIDADVMAALTSLGYSIVEAQSAIQMIPNKTPEDLETRIRIALQYFS